MKHSYDMFDMGEERSVIYPKKKKHKKSKKDKNKFKIIPVTSEEDIFKELDMDYVEPKDRNPEQ